MSTIKYRAGLSFVGGIVVGVLVGLAVPRMSGFALISRQDVNNQLQLIADLQKENYELTDDLFAYQRPDVVFDTADLPYKDDADASKTVSSARQRALNAGKFLMVTFGANWCLDCRTLYHHLRSPEVQPFTADTFEFVNVNVGKVNINVDLAADLGVDLQRGIPVAIFFGPNGQVIGTTNNGQLAAGTILHIQADPEVHQRYRRQVANSCTGFRSIAEKSEAKPEHAEKAGWNQLVTFG